MSIRRTIIIGFLQIFWKIIIIMWMEFITVKNIRRLVLG